MKPLAIFRHSSTEGPGYCSTFFAARNVPFQVIKVDQGEPVPQSIEPFSGFIFMGGPMSVNDALPWIRDELSLIQKAVANNVPVLGHCLGGQLMAKALGAQVTRNAVREIGWGMVSVQASRQAKEWLDDAQDFLAFHWHGETFALPPGAIHLASSSYCPNQMFSIGNHLAMQCHVEMTERLIEAWCAVGIDEIAANPGPAVQAPTAMQENLETRLCDLHAIADRIYSRWLAPITGPAV